MGKRVAFDRDGKKILPDVRVGNERLDSTVTPISGEHFVACSEHGTSTAVYVRSNRPAMINKCCVHCVRQHCQITTAVYRSVYLADGSPVIASDEGNPNGHSF